jgi:[ribosomal protein S18]-alanine N-acetyltransferase
MIFESLTIEDVAIVLPLERAANAYPWTEAAFNSSMAGNYLNFKLLNSDRQLVGFYIAQLIADQLELFNICVSVAEQGKGYGRLLLQHFLAQGKLRGATEALLEVRANNHRAIALYQHTGFSADGLRKHYYVDSAGKEDAVLMRCELS